MAGHDISRRAALGGGACAIAALAVAGTGAMARPAQRFAVTKTAAEWRRSLGAARFAILREGGTERPGTSPLNREKRQGTFACAGCALPLFSSSAKYESGTGWPSFFRALPNAVATRTDRSLGMIRKEALCRRCGGHLGHIFDDGPRPTGLRYCVNGLSLRFRPD